MDYDLHSRCPVVLGPMEKLTYGWKMWWSYVVLPVGADLDSLRKY